MLCVLQAQGQVQLEARCAVSSRAWVLRARWRRSTSTAPTTPPCCPPSPPSSPRTRPSTRVITLGAPIALIAIQAIQQAHSSTKLYTFDTNAAEIAKIKSGAVQWAVDQQPYVQGYESVDSLWLYLTNGDILGGGQTVLTGPSFIDSTNVAKVASTRSAAPASGRVRGPPGLPVAPAPREEIPMTADAAGSRRPRPATSGSGEVALARLFARPEVGALTGAIVIFVFFFIIAPPFRYANSLSTVLYVSVDLRPDGHAGRAADDRR